MCRSNDTESSPGGIAGCDGDAVIPGSLPGVVLDGVLVFFFTGTRFTGVRRKFLNRLIRAMTITPCIIKESNRGNSYGVSI